MKETRTRKRKRMKARTQTRTQTRMQTRMQQEKTRTQTRMKQDANTKLRHKWQRKKKLDRIEPVTRAKALIPDDVILTRSESLDIGYRVLDDATSSEGR